MSDVLTKVIDRGGVPTTEDIANILASIGAPGENQQQKRDAVQELFDVVGGGTNSQGHAVVNDLDSYREY